MDQSLERLIELIEKSIDLEAPEKIQEIEEEIQEIFQKLKTNFLSQSEEDNNIDKNKIDKLGHLLEKLNKKHKAQKKFLEDFSTFLKDRKIN